VRACRWIDLCRGQLQRLFAAVKYLVMGRAPLEVREHRLRPRRHVGSLIVFAP